jgi:hypothetical protein
MFKKPKLILMLIALLPALAMTAQPVQANDAVAEQSNVEKKHKLSVCALFRNEAMYLKEWLEYHQMVGVEHFYLYDNGSRDRPREVLAPYIRKGLVTLVNWPDRVVNRDSEMVDHWALSTQLPAYENASKYYAVNDSEWLLFLDVDEFIVPVNASSVNEVLSNYSEYPGLELTSDFFDASNRELPKRELLIANIDLTDRPAQNIRKSIEKTIFKPSCNTSFTWPPYKCNFKDNQQARRLSKAELRINKYVNRNQGELNFGKIKEKLRVDSRALTDSEKTELLQIGYQIEDKERVIYRFEPGLRKRLGIESGWNH